MAHTDTRQAKPYLPHFVLVVLSERQRRLQYTAHQLKLCAQHSMPYRISVITPLILSHHYLKHVLHKFRCLTRRNSSTVQITPLSGTIKNQHFYLKLSPQPIIRVKNAALLPATRCAYNAIKNEVCNNYHSFIKGQEGTIS